MDDGSGVMLPYMTEVRTNILENAFAGFQLTEELVHFGQDFHQRLTAALRGVDVNAPEAIQLMSAWRELESKFKAFMDLVPFSDMLQLRAMLAQTEDFEAKLKTLPSVRKKVYKKPPKAEDEVTKTANKAEEGEEAAQPVFN